MSGIAEIVLSRLQATWHRHSTALFASLLAGVASGYIMVTRLRQHAPWPWAAIVALASALVVYAVWRLEHRVPRSKRGNVGFVVAIACESDRHERQIRADFIEQLTRNLGADQLKTRFEVLVYPRWLADKVVETGRPAEFQARSRAHFIVHGRVRIRADSDGKEAQYLSLEGGVLHAAVHPQTQGVLRKELHEAMPRRVEVPNAASVFHFEVASSWLELAARYVVGLAALISADPEYAEPLLLDVERRLPGISSKVAPLRKVAQRLPSYLIQLYGSWVQALSAEYTRTRDDTLLPQIEAVVDKLLARQPTDYNGLLVKAMADFMLRRDVKSAKARLNGCKKQKDPTWRYSLAFLLAYEGKLTKAQDEYSRAFKVGSLDQTVPIQSEEFIQRVVEVEPSRSQLHFASALINLHAKRDFAAARRDFAAFLSATESSSYPAQRAAAERALREIPVDLSAGSDVHMKAVGYFLQPLEEETRETS